MRVYGVQMSLGASKGENLDKALRYIENCAGADLVVLPEMLMGGRSSGVELYDLAEDVEQGDFAKALSKAAVDNKTDVCACLWEPNGTDKVYNTAMVYGADGGVKAKYRKLHLFDALSVKESDFMTAGDDKPPVFECGGFRVGVSICYDLRFPEVYRSLVADGAELFVVPAAWYAGDMKVEHLRTMLCARALENTSYALCADLTGGDFAGHSAVYSPFGELVSSTGLSEGVISADLSMEYLCSVRGKLPSLKNMRQF